jgi:hypothetical protein
MKKFFLALAIIFSAISSAQTGTTTAGKFRAMTATKDNNATRVVVQDSISKEYRWVLKNSLGGGSVDSVTGTAVTGTATNPIVNIPTLQTVLDNNRELLNGNNFQGTDSGFFNSGNNNIGFGQSSLSTNTGDNNIAFGYQSGLSNTGYLNVFNGSDAGNSNTGNNNVFIGNSAGNSNSGDYCVAIGNSAGSNNTYDYSIMLGFGAFAQANNQVVFGFGGSTKGIFDYNLLTSTRTASLPDKSGTIAFLDDITAGSGTVTSVTATSPLTGGTITSTGSIGIQDAAADNTTKGASTYFPADFNSSAGAISIDYVNTQKASASQPGALSSSDWSLFNGKQNAISLTTSGTGAATFVGNTLNIPTPSISALGGITATSTDTFQNKTISGSNNTLSNIAQSSVVNLTTDLASKQRDLFEFNAKEGVYLYENFLGTGLIPSSLSGWSGESTGAGSSILTTSTYPNRTNQQGVLRLATGTTTTGLAQGRLGDNNAGSHYLGGGVYTLQFFVNIETLSDVTNRFYDIFGATTNSTFSNTSGMFFVYDEGIGVYGAASPNWKCITRNGGAITSTITSVPVVASQWYVLRIVVNSAGTSIEFFIDGVSVATHTTNLPTLVTPRIAHVKTTGTTSRNAFVDYAILQQVFSSPRPN